MQESSAAVGVVPVGAVAEHDEELVTVDEGPQTQPRAVQTENHIPGRSHGRTRFNVGHRYQHALRLCISGERGRYTIAGIDREPFGAREVARCRVIGVLRQEVVVIADRADREREAAGSDPTLAVRGGKLRDSGSGRAIESGSLPTAYPTGAGGVCRWSAAPRVRSQL